VVNSDVPAISGERFIRISKLVLFNSVSILFF